MKEATWDNPNKMHFESEHKTFNRSIVSVMTGNVIGGGQHSSYVRPYGEVSCNGFPFAPGELRAHNMESFRSMPRSLSQWVSTSENREVKMIIYRFYHEDSRRVHTHGWIVTRAVDYALLAIAYTGATWKSDSAIDACAEYVSERIDGIKVQYFWRRNS